MGFGGISIWQLLIVLVIVLLVFGTKKLRNVGGDLGGAIKSFKKAVNEDGSKADADADTEIEDDSEDSASKKSEDSVNEESDDDESEAKAEAANSRS